MRCSTEVRFANKVPYPSDDNISASDVINKWYILYMNTLYIGIFMAIDFNVCGRREVLLISGSVSLSCEVRRPRKLR